MYIRYNLKKVVKKVTPPQKKTRQKQIKNKKTKKPAKYNENNPPNSQPLPKYLLSIK